MEKDITNLRQTSILWWNSIMNTAGFGRHNPDHRTTAVDIENCAVAEVHYRMTGYIPGHRTAHNRVAGWGPVVRHTDWGDPRNWDDLAEAGRIVAGQVAVGVRAYVTAAQVVAEMKEYEILAARRTRVESADHREHGLVDYIADYTVEVVGCAVVRTTGRVSG